MTLFEHSILQQLQATAELAVQYGREANERLGQIEKRLEAVESRLGLGRRERDTLPAPPTEPSVALQED